MRLMPSICELPQGSAAGKYLLRRILTSCSSNFGGLSEPEPIGSAIASKGKNRVRRDSGQ